jgi:hypothetical protein
VVRGVRGVIAVVGMGFRMLSTNLGFRVVFGYQSIVGGLLFILEGKITNIIALMRELSGKSVNVWK